VKFPSSVPIKTEAIEDGRLLASDLDSIAGSLQREII